MPASLSQLHDELSLGLASIRELWYYQTKNWVTDVHAADINRDGDIEVIAASRDGRVYILTREGEFVNYNVVGNKIWVSSVVALLRPQEHQAVRLVAGTRDGKVYALDQEGKGIAKEHLPLFQSSNGSSKNGSSSHSSSTGCLYDTHRSILQIHTHPLAPQQVVFSSEDRCAYSLDLTTGAIRWRFPTGGRVRTIFSCDLDGDGLLETLIGSHDQYLYVVDAYGKERAKYYLGHPVYSLFAEDIDLDGQIEILIGTRAKTLVVLNSKLEVKWSFPVSSRILALTVADFNNDQRKEILASCDNRMLYILNDKGEPMWVHSADARYSSLYAADVDHDGHIEVLAGGEDNMRVYCLRIQLRKGLDQKIRRLYSTLGKPDLDTLLTLTGNQRRLLEGLLGGSHRNLDKSIHIDNAKALLEKHEYTNALLVLLKLERQRVQLRWAREDLGYLTALCLSDITGDVKEEVLVGTLNGKIYTFTSSGRLLWSTNFQDQQITDIQSGYFSHQRGKDLLAFSPTDRLTRIGHGRKRETTSLDFDEPVSCFHVLASEQKTSDILIGTDKNQILLYSTKPLQLLLKLDIDADVQSVYATASHEGFARSPEILVGASTNRIYAYTRGGNLLWMYDAHERIRSFCAKDLDGDGRLEILIGTDDRNILILDNLGKLRWRYILAHSVTALEVADLDGDGVSEVMAGSEDGVLSIFKATGDLIWRYQARDRIQALRVADIDRDGNVEIAVVLEDRLEILQIVNQDEITALIDTCWSQLQQEQEPLEALLSATLSTEPNMRAFALERLATLDPLPPQVFEQFHKALDDTFADVRKTLIKAVMRVYRANPEDALLLLDKLFRDPIRDVRVEVIENLEILAPYDWTPILSYLRRACADLQRAFYDSSDRNTRRAAIRKIAHLVDIAEEEQIESLFELLLDTARDEKSEWIRLESGRTLAHLLEVHPEKLVPYFYRMMAAHLGPETLEHIDYSLSPSPGQDAFNALLALHLHFDENDPLELLSVATTKLRAIGHLEAGTDTWLIFNELQKLWTLSTLDELARYETHLTAKQLSSDNEAAQRFWQVFERFSALTRTLKIYLNRYDLTDRLNSLLDGIKVIEELFRLTERVYGIPSTADSLKVFPPELEVMQKLLANWQEMIQAQRKELRGHAELVCELRPRRVHYEETVEVWLRISNHGHSAANNVQVTLLSGERFEADSSSFKTDIIFSHREVTATFLIRPHASLSLSKPLFSSINLSFEIAYDASDNELKTQVFREHLEFIEWQRNFTPIDNPYSTGTPTQDRRMCYGREVALTYLKDNLTRTTAQTVLVLYGQRRSGKTTLLFQLMNTPLLISHVPVLIDMQRLSYKLDICKFFFRVAYFIFEAMTREGLYARQPERSDFVDDPTFAFDCFLDAAEPSLQKRKLILLIDEFEVLEEQVRKGQLEPEVFQYLRSLMQHRQYMHFLLSGTHKIEQLTKDYWAVFFNIALHYFLPGKITTSGAEALIVEPVSGQLEYEPLAVTKIRLLTADQPYLLHIVCRALVDHCNQQAKNYVTINDVNRVLHEVMNTGSIHFDWIWEQLASIERALLAAIAKGSIDEGRLLTRKDIQEICQQHQISYTYEEIMDSLDTLQDANVIEAINDAPMENSFNNTRYCISNGLLRQWLLREKPLEYIHAN